MDWDKILVEVVTMSIQCIAYKWVHHRMSHPWTMIIPMVACVVFILLTSTVYGPVVVLVLSIVLLYWGALGCR